MCSCWLKNLRIDSLVLSNKSFNLSWLFRWVLGSRGWHMPQMPPLGYAPDSNRVLVLLQFTLSLRKKRNLIDYFFPNMLSFRLIYLIPVSEIFIIKKNNLKYHKVVSYNLRSFLYILHCVSFPLRESQN